ncbi:MAG TPA: ETC complex I subunit [Acetobacteraceae bacterium]|nr:ETC complex I subunit [Acetobacteraceae bacterium]
MARMVRIFQPPRTAMQSGWAGTREWVLVYEPEEPQVPDPLMGWIGGGSTEQQVRLTFDTREEAIAFAEKYGLSFEIETPPERKFRPKSYAENFRYGRREAWTH